MAKPRATSRPTVQIITTGGTIAATLSGMLTATDLLASIPDLNSKQNEMQIGYHRQPRLASSWPVT